MYVSVLILTLGLADTAAANNGPAVLSERSLGTVPAEDAPVWAFAGVSGGALLLAGGRETGSDGRPVGTDAVFVLPLPDGKWQRAPQRLPQAVWGGAAVTYKDEFICAGGTDGTRNHDAVFKLKWVDGRLTITPLQPLPSPHAHLSAAVLEDVLYLAGGTERPGDAEPQHTFWALDLSTTPRREGWQELTPWPGRGRMDATLTAQDGSLYLIGGTDSRNVEMPLRTAFRFTPQSGQWDGKWHQIADLPQAVSAAASVALGQSHIAVIGGRRAGGTAEPDDVLAYHTVTDTWVVRGKLDASSRRSAAAVSWEDETLLIGGWLRDDQPAEDIVLLEPLPPRSRFGWVGWSIVVGYFAALLWIGYYFSRRERSTDDYFYAGRRVPWWAAGLSIFGTQVSAISFLAIPGIAYATDWVRLMNSLMYSVVMPIVIVVFVPFYCRMRVATAYEYLERRFNESVRLLGSTLFIAGQLMRIGVVVYLPALALAAVTGADILLCVVAMAAVSIIYTVMGGIEAVIWSDVLQVVVLVGGALLALGMMIYSVGGIGQMVTVSATAGKFHMVNWGWDATELVLWVMIVGPLFLDISPYVTDQAVVQRYLTTSDEKQAARGLWMNLVFNIPIAFLFYGIGSALFAFCKTYPEQVAVGKNDEVYPWYIVQQLPPVISGLVIAGVFAASMSSLDSSMNSLATAVVSDFYRRFRPAVTDEVCLRLARWITVATGVFGGVIAVLLARTEMAAIWDTLRVLFGFTGGALLGVFLLAGLTRRANGGGALVGVPAGILAAAVAATRTELSFMLYGAIGAVMCVVVGYLASLMIPARERDLSGLTVWTMPSSKATPQSAPPS